MKKNIAIANPHSLLRLAVSEIIRTTDEYNVIIEAAQGVELLDKICQCDQEINLLITEINFIDKNGYEIVALLRKRRPDLRILILTQFCTEFSILTLIKFGVNGYILDNCSPTELKAAIGDIIDHGYYYSSVATEKVFRLVKNNQLLHLTEKELKFLTLFCSDLSFEKIGTMMHVSVRTVQSYQQIIADKLNIHSRLGLALFAVHSGLESSSFQRRF